MDIDAHSWSTFDPVVERMAQLIAPATVLDIGAGSGKYGQLIRKIAPGAHIAGVEIDPAVAARNRLGAIYDEVINLSAADYMHRHPARAFDLVIIGDCIEHLPKSEGIDLLNFLTYRAAYTLVIAPECMPMNLEPFYRGHNSVWTQRDFQWHDNWAFGRFVQQQLFLLRGYHGPAPALYRLAQTINEDKIPIDYVTGLKGVFVMNLFHSAFTFEENGEQVTFRPY